MTLDLKIPDAIALVKRLVLDYDIVIEQFRPGVMDKLGLSYAILKDINPRLIYCSLTGYGQTGPYRQRAGHDINYLSVAGINGYSGKRNAATPLMGIQVADLAGGSMQALVGILAAVNQRHVTGKGQTVDVSMTDGVFALNSLAGSGYLGAGVAPQPQSFELNGGSF
jgi:crotonobetainyl-CoA:carnitine CoA-transferase CaiB-like acyl-CoA transferase